MQDPCCALEDEILVHAYRQLLLGLVGVEYAAVFLQGILVCHEHVLGVVAKRCYDFVARLSRHAVVVAEYNDTLLIYGHCAREVFGVFPILRQGHCGHEAQGKK